MSGDLDFPMEKDKVVEPGMYKARVKKIERKQGKKNDYLKWLFEIVDDEDFEGTVVGGITSLKFTPKTSGFKWVSAILGITEVSEGEMIPVGSCVEKYCRVVVDNKEKDGSTFSNVEKVLPSKKKKSAEDEEEEQPKKKKVVEEEEAPKKKRVVEEDEEEAPKKKKVVEEDDEEEEAPKKKKVVEEEDDEEPAPKKKKPADDDDDDIEPVKKKAAVEDDEVEAPKKKKKVDDEDDDEIF